MILEGEHRNTGEITFPCASFFRHNSHVNWHDIEP
jgi:hypothetical protein